MNRIIYSIALGGITIFSALYLVAMILEPQAKLQVISMLGFDAGSSQAVYYGWFYTIALGVTSVAGMAVLFSRAFVLRVFMIVAASGCLTMTLVPLVHSLLHDYSPGFYENYVGEWLTCLTSVLLIVAVAIMQPHKKVTEQVAASDR